MGRQFAIVAAVIALLTAGALLIVRRVTEPLPPGRTPSRSLAPEEAPAGQPGRLPFAPPAPGGPGAPGTPGAFGAPVTVSDADAEAEAAGQASPPPAPAPAPPPPAEEVEERQTPARPPRSLNRQFQQLRNNRINTGDKE